jgi:hypothetical protein
MLIADEPFLIRHKVRPQRKMKMIASRSTRGAASERVRTLAQSSEQMLDSHRSFGKPVAERCHD